MYSLNYCAQLSTKNSCSEHILNNHRKIVTMLCVLYTKHTNKKVCSSINWQGTSTVA